jgi:hypothetical protein
MLQAERAAGAFRISEPADLNVCEPPRLGEEMRRIEPRSLVDLSDQPFPELASGVVSIPIERRRKR